MRGLETLERYCERRSSYVLSKVLENVLGNRSFLNEIAINLTLKLTTFLNMKPFKSTFQARLDGVLIIVLDILEFQEQLFSVIGGIFRTQSNICDGAF